MAPVPTTSESGLCQLYERILTSWNRRDAAGMAAQFEEDGNLVGLTEAKSIPAPRSRPTYLPSLLTIRPRLTLRRSKR